MRKLLIAVLSMSLFCILIPINTIKAEENNEPPFKILSGAIIKDGNGDTLSEVDLNSNYEISIASPSLYSLRSSEDVVEYVVSTEVVFNPMSETDGIQPLGIVGDVSGADVIGYLYMQFSWYPTTEMIQVTKVYGSWDVPSVYHLSDRIVDAWTDANTSGFPKYPTTNSFSYTTGWGREQWYPPSAVSGAKANSTAYVTVPGMTGGETYLFLFCEIAYEDL